MEADGIDDMVIAYDKKLHILAGFLIVISLAWWSVLYGFLAACIIGAVKELVWDKMFGKGTPELADFIATAIGGGIGVGVMVVLNAII